MSADERTIVGMAVVDSSDEPITGSIIVECLWCHGPTWLAPTGQAMLLDASGVICTRCAFRHYRDHPEDFHRIETAPGAIEELATQLADEARKKRGEL